MEEKVSKTLKSKSEMKTSTGSSFFRCEFIDGSSFTFFRSSDVDLIKSFDLNTTFTFTAYQKGDWNNGKDITIGSTDPIPNEIKLTGTITLQELLRNLTSAVYELIGELKKQ